MDTAAGVIRGVKVLGLVSQNGRKYLPEAITKAAPMYEGIGVFLDHPVRPSEQRSARDRIGWLENVRVLADGLYADLHLLTADPATAKILEAAQKRPDLFGLSHNAEGRGTHEAGVFVVAEITEVKSVDLVADPATNRSLFEGTTIATELREDDADRDKSWKDKAMEAIGKLCESEDDSDKELGAKLKKAMDPEPTKEQDEDDNDADSASQESKIKKPTAPGAIALTEQQVQKLLKMNGLEATAELMEALQGADLDQATAIMAIAKRTAPAPRQSDPPRSTSRTTIPINEGVLPKDAEGWAKKLLA